MRAGLGVEAEARCEGREICFLMRTPVTGLGPTLIQPNPILTNYIRKDRFNKYDHILRF